MVYRKLRLELGNQTITRTIKIEMESENNPGFNVFVEDRASTEKVGLSRAVGFYGPKWHRTKKDAVSTAQGMVQTGIREGFAIAV
jgi:hypothetical protein